MAWTCESILGLSGTELCSAVDHYCERTIDAWYAEPINAFSNIAFIIAGWAAWRLLRHSGELRKDFLMVSTVALIPTVGLGSFVFHTLATRWAEWLDVIPIGLFLTFYLWLVLRILLNWPITVRSSVVGVFIFSTLASEAFVSEEFLWGGAMYLPTIAVLLGLTALTAGARNGASAVFITATGGFLTAYAMRTIDNAVCPILPTGTHMLWHLLNAALMYLLIRLLVKQSINTRLASSVVTS